MRVGRCVSLDLSNLTTDFFYFSSCADFHKTDRYNRPIFIQDLRNLHIDQVFKHTTPDRIVQFFAVSLENAIRRKYAICTRLNREQAKEAGTMDQDQLKKLIIDDNFMIINAANLGMGTFWSVSCFYS